MSRHHPINKLIQCKKPARMVDLTGAKFGNWSVIRYGGKKFYGGSSFAQFWLCVCSCGAERLVQQVSLKSGSSTGCGACCSHGVRGNSKHPLYSTWLGMKGRCHNPNHSDYRDYGGRGIRVCERWRKSFKAFLEDVGERPAGKTLDRRNNSLGYSPDNVRWSSPSKQQRNRRPFKSKLRRTRHIIAMLARFKTTTFFPELDH